MKPVGYDLGDQRSVVPEIRRQEDEQAARLEDAINFAIDSVRILDVFHHAAAHDDIHRGILDGDSTEIIVQQFHPVDRRVELDQVDADQASRLASILEQHGRSPSASCVQQRMFGSQRPADLQLERPVRVLVVSEVPLQVFFGEPGHAGPRARARHSSAVMMNLQRDYDG